MLSIIMNILIAMFAVILVGVAYDLYTRIMLNKTFDKISTFLNQRVSELGYDIKVVNTRYHYLVSDNMYVPLIALSMHRLTEEGKIYLGCSHITISIESILLASKNTKISPMVIANDIMDSLQAIDNSTDPQTIGNKYAMDEETYRKVTRIISKNEKELSACK